MAKRLATPPRALPLALGLLRPRRRQAAVASAPKIALSIDRVDIEASRLRAWRAACGYDDSASVPLPYLFVLSFNALAALLLDRGFPLSPVGMVHLASSLASHEEIQAGDELRLELSLLGWRQVRLGREVEIEIRYFKGEKEVARGVQTSLGRGGGTGEKRVATERAGRPNGAFDEWTLAADMGRRYARISGDWNPIHLWPLTALAFGYRKPIAHGMYLVARACAVLDPRGEDAGRQLDVRFKTPAQLPAKLRCYLSEHGFELWRGDGSRPHVIGRLTTGTNRSVAADSEC